MKNFKALAVAVLLAVAPLANAGTIYTEDAAVDLEILMVADLIEAYKVSVSNADMDDSGITLGVLNFTPNSLDAAKSLAADLCKDPSDATISYTGANSCSIVDNGNVSASHAVLAADFDVLVELSGPGSIQLDMTLAGNVNSDAAFQASAVEFSNLAQSVSGLVDQGTEVISWGGEMHFDEGPTFEETIQIDVIKN